MSAHEGRRGAGGGAARPSDAGTDAEESRRRRLDAVAWSGRRSLEERLRIARHRLALTAATGVAAAGVIVAGGFFPPFLVLAIPPALLAVDLQRKLRSLAARGYGFWDVVSSGDHTEPAPAAGSDPLPPGVVPAARRPGARPAEVAPPAAPYRLWRDLPAPALRGRHAGAVRASLEDGAAILALVESLDPVQREMLPELPATIEGLVTRAGTLAATLDSLDANVTSAELPGLESRIAQAEALPESAEAGRRLALLQHQRDTVRDLLARRAAFAEKLESVTLALRSLRFDLLRLRSAEARSALDAMTHVTQHVHALSREIGSLLEGAEGVRDVGDRRR